jgi:outer membrane protein W
MKRNVIFSVLIGWFILIFPFLSHGEEKPTQKDSQNEVRVIKKKPWGVAIGVRSTYFQMQQNTGPIIGNVNLLDEEQNLAPYKPNLQFNFLKYWALEFGYDQFKATALNKGAGDVAEHDKSWADGAIEWQPIMMAFQFRWPHFHRSVVPYVLGGISYTKTSWDRNEWYYFGFPSLAEYNNWTSQGNRPENYPNYGYRRIFTVDDHTMGPLVGLGVDYFIWKNLALNLDWRYLWAQVNFKYTLVYNAGGNIIQQRQGTFVLDSWILGLGVKYFF